MNANIAVPWGKLGPEGCHPLVDHCLDVACVLRALLDIPNMARWAVSFTSTQKDRLAVIAYLHDVGKCNAGFQAKAEPNARVTAGHVMEAVALLRSKDLWPKEWLGLLCDLVSWFGNDGQAALQMLLAAISHHGRPVSENDYENSPVERNPTAFWRPRQGFDPMRALDDLARAVRAAFPEAFAEGVPPIEATPALQQRFAGLVMLADWIASDTQFFPFRAAPEEDRRAVAQQATRRALAAIGLKPPLNRVSRPFEAVFRFAPTPLQKYLSERIAIDETSRLVIVESDTGSGKTEAALAWFFRLYAEGQVDGLYFALPTRVAARELYERVCRAIDAAFDGAHRPGPVLLAVPGYVKVDNQPVLPDPVGTLWDETGELQRERFWSAERPKRFLAAPIAVGTLDQALLAALKVKHSLLRSVCLDRHLLVVDEVHASDPYMSAILQNLLEGHLARGGWALLLSATLGESAASRYLGRDPMPLAAAKNRPYPSISTSAWSLALPAIRQRRIDIELAPTLTDDEALLPCLIGALDRGARVLVITNTVRRANALFRRIESELERQHPELLSALFSLNGVRCPHHGRFAREDRECLDAQVTKLMGKGSTCAPLLLIGTQTLEQSLDIDADWLITDLAPMDVLIQRFGRLHRHDRGQRPRGFDTLKALVRVPDKDLDEYLDCNGNLKAPAGLGIVYADGRALACTWQTLRQHSTLALPSEARWLIEHTTHSEAFDALPEVWRRHGDNVIGKTLSEICLALASTLADKPFGELHYADKSERIVTRLSEATYDIPLAQKHTSPFGVPIERVALPARWLEGCQLPERIEAEPTAQGFRFEVDGRVFLYTRFGLEKETQDA